MQKSKFIDRLALLSKTELREFEKFINTDYFNTNKKVVKLYRFAKKYHPEFESSKLERNYVIKKLFPEWGKDGYKRLSYVMSDANKLLDDFFIQQQLKSDQIQQQQLLLQAYKNRGGNWFFLNLAEQLKKEILKSEQQHAAHYQTLFNINHEEYIHISTARTDTGIKSLEEAMKSLDYFYANTKFRYAAEVSFRKYLTNEEIEVVLLKEFQESLKTDYWDGHLVLRIFAGFVNLIQTLDAIDYQDLKELIFNNFTSFDRANKLDILTFLLNFCIVQSNNGKIIYRREMFDIYVIGLENKVWLNQNVIAHQQFDNIVTIGCLLKEFDWTEQFILEYAPYLDEQLRENVKQLALAGLAFSKGNFEQTLSLINQIEFIDVNQNWRAKSLQIRCYYELEDYSLMLHDFCLSFAQYCRRNKSMGTQIKEMNLNLIHFINRLQKFKFEGKTSKEELKQDLLQIDKVQCRTWVLEKIKAL